MSTFNAEHLIEGCLQNLVNQTIFAEGRMEILIIDSGSEQQECKIVEEFQNADQSIVYFRTDERESLYKSWNRAIGKARGQYLTNANTDDRHHPKCIELLCQSLDENPACGLSYGNLFKSLKSNEIFAGNDKSIPCESQKFFPGSLLLHDYIGAQPVWRKSIHDKIGLFDEKYEVVGDYEFVLRAVSNGCKFSYVPEAQGLMLWHKNALSTKDSKALSEKHELLKFYRSPEQIKKIYSPYFRGNSIFQKAYNDLGIRSLCYYPQFNSGNPLFDFSFAQECFSRNSDHISQLNLKSFHNILDPQSNVESTKKGNLFFYSYSEKLPAEYELKGVDPLYIRKVGNENIQDKVYQKYSFNLSKFYQYLFGHLDIESISNTNCVYIWGYNERGKILAKYLESIGFKNIRFLDSNPQICLKKSKSTKNLPIGFQDVKDTENVIFILTMSSHHWPTVRTEIEKKLPGTRVLTFDKA